MSDRPYWATILQWTLWGLLMTAIMGWLNKARLKGHSADNAGLLAYPRAVLVVSLVATLLFTACAVFTLFAPAKNAPWWTTVLFGGIAIVSAHSLIDCWVGRYRVTEEGLLYTSPFVRNRMFRWEELSVRYAPSMKWFILRGSNGKVARVSIMMTGLPEFARLVLNHVQPIAIDVSALGILRQTAKGELPSVWL